MTVFRARKIQKFLSQPFHVAENIYRYSWKICSTERNVIRGFKAIIDGEMDEYPENAFFNVGTIEDVIAKAKAEGGLIRTILLNILGGAGGGGIGAGRGKIKIKRGF